MTMFLEIVFETAVVASMAELIQLAAMTTMAAELVQLAAMTAQLMQLKRHLRKLVAQTLAPFEKTASLHLFASNQQPIRAQNRKD